MVSPFRVQHHSFICINKCFVFACCVVDWFYFTHRSFFLLMQEVDVQIRISSQVKFEDWLEIQICRCRLPLLAMKIGSKHVVILRRMSHVRVCLDKVAFTIRGVQVNHLCRACKVTQWQHMLIFNLFSLSHPCFFSYTDHYFGFKLVVWGTNQIQRNGFQKTVHVSLSCFT